MSNPNNLIESPAVSRSYFPVYLINWIFGIGVIEYPLGTPRPVISFLYSLATILSFSAINVLSYNSLTSFPYISKVTVSLQLFFYSQILLTIATISLGWLRSKALNKCLTNALTAGNLMSRIGIKNDPIRMLKYQTRRIIVDLAFVLCVTGINSYMIVYNEMFGGNRTFMIITIAYPVIIMFIADSTFICSRLRFSQVNDVLLAMLTSTTDSPQHKRILKAINDSVKFPIYVVNGLPKNQALIIKIAKQIHLLLIKVCQEADNLYGIQTLLSLIAAFAVITGNLYMLYVLLTDPRAPLELQYQTLVVANVWIIYYAIKISFISYTCDHCKCESIRTGDIINQLYDDSTINEESQTEIRDFNVQMIQKPLKFSAYGFVDLDFTLVQGMIATITTYLMILIQLGKMPGATTINNDYTTKIK